MTERGKNDTLVAVTRGNVTRSLLAFVLWLSQEETSPGHLVRTYTLFSLKRSAQTYVSTSNGRLLRGQRMVADNFADMPHCVCSNGTAQIVLSVGSFDRVSHVKAVRFAIRQSQGGARLRHGNSGQSGGYQELHGEWRMRRADELSRRFQESRNVRPLTWNSSRSPQRCGAWEASAKRSQQRPLQRY